MDNTILRLSTWWGLSDKPGKQYMLINNDGSFVIKVEYSRPKDKTGDFEKTGIIDQERLTKLKTFADKNLTQSSDRVMMDAGHTIKYYPKNKKVIEIENGNQFWGTLMELVPEFNHPYDDLK